MSVWRKWYFYRYNTNIENTNLNCEATLEEEHLRRTFVYDIYMPKRFSVEPTLSTLIVLVGGLLTVSHPMHRFIKQHRHTSYVV